MKESLPKTYHHGDLRQSVIDVAIETLESEGLDKLSLRAIAKKLGVSHAAPNHHFENINKLRNAVAIKGFELFDLSMQNSRNLAPQEPKAQMRAAETGYIDFARYNQNLFRLMFSAHLLDWSDINLLEAARKSRKHLIEICEAALDEKGNYSLSEAASLERLVWSQIHGKAHLLIDGQFNFGQEICEPISIADENNDITAMVFNYYTRK